jgi:hypothetical protein
VAQAAATKAPPSFSDALGDVYMSIANAKLAQDADLKFLNQLELVVIGRLKHSDQQPGGAQPPGPGGPPGGGAPQGPPPGGAPPGGPPLRGNATPGGGPPANAAVPPPDMDAVRKDIAATTGP